MKDEMSDIPFDMLKFLGRFLFKRFLFVKEFKIQEIILKFYTELL